MNFDVVVIGAGHAGIEAAVASARMGARTAVITFSQDDIGTMSCNPAMGGLGKGHLIREIDAMGGIIGRASDLSGIQFRMLNKTRGEAVQGPRAQIDRNLYRTNCQKLLKNEKISFIYDEVINILTHRVSHKELISGVETSNSLKIKCSTIIVTTGTFLAGRIFCGKESWSAGRLGSRPALKLSRFFKDRGFSMLRLKTGTPPRIVGSSINYKKCVVQKGDKNPVPFSFLTKSISTDQVECYITHTNKSTHKIITENIGLSPLYDGKIDSKGPRYCPSIEDKVKRFKDRTRHQIFLEPETISGEIIYPNGISTSLPKHVQLKFVKSINGLENAIIDKFGYAIEYDCIDTTEINNSFETKKIKGLYLAGQINGTTGYEEAAAQGLLAGINAARQIQNKNKIVIHRSEGYLGVLTSDLCKAGLIEPYRMFTSRAEYRLFLRADNADERLTDIGIKVGTVKEKQKKKWLQKKNLIKTANKTLHSLKASPQTYKKFGLKINLDGKKRSAFEILGYPDSKWSILKSIWPQICELQLDSKTENQIQVNSFYSRYTQRQKSEIEDLRKDEGLLLDIGIKYKKCPGLSSEVRELLEKSNPRSIGEARALPGMTPAAAAILLRYVKK